MPRRRINKATLHYQQSGHGRDLILVHGLFSNLAFWYLTVVPLLAKRFKVTVYDLRGHGFSEQTGHGYRAIDMAEDLASLMDHLGIERAHVVGHSFGGAVALAFAVKHAALVSSLTLADAWLPSLQPLGKKFWNKHHRRLNAEGINVQGQKIPKVAYSFFEELISEKKNPDSNIHPDRELEDVLKGSLSNSLAMKKWWQLMNSTAALQELQDATGITEPDIKRVSCPVTVAFGEKSKYLSTQLKLSSILADCDVRKVPDAGHFFPIFRPGFFVDILLRSAAVSDHPT